MVATDLSLGGNAVPELQWYALSCRTYREAYVARTLQTLLGAAVYLPVVTSAKRLSSAVLFPGYLFAHINLHHHAPSRIATVPGVIRLVGDAAEPIPIAASVISELQQRVEQINARGGIIEYAFEVGNAVRIKNGPLGGLEAIFQGPTVPSARVRVLLEFLGQPRNLELDVDAIELVSPLQHPPRRTRGKGRRITARG